MARKIKKAHKFGQKGKIVLASFLMREEEVRDDGGLAD
jgi:hypothetical protein